MIGCTGPVGGNFFKGIFFLDKRIETDGVWECLPTVGEFRTKAEGVAAATRMGIDLDYIGWHQDSINVTCLF